MQSTPISEDVRTLVLELFDPEMTEVWGWGKTFQPTRLALGPLSEDVRAIVWCGALDVPYFGSATVAVDLVAETVQCWAVDQKTPAEKQWTLTPRDAWWRRARACTTWPIARRTS